MQKLNAALVCFFPLLLTLAACTFSAPKVGVTVRWLAPESASRSRAAPTTVNDVSCFFINVTGAGLAPNYGPQDFGGRTPECLGVGTIAGPFPLDKLQQGVRLTLQPGANRRIEVLGAISPTLGKDCQGVELPGYFDTTVAPQLYLLGATEQNLFVDERVEVKNSYQLATAEDRVEACPGSSSSGGSDGNTPNNPPTGAVAFALFNSDPHLRLFYYDHTAQAFTFWKSVEPGLPGNPRSLHLSRDNTRLFIRYNDNTSDAAAVFAVAGTRDVTQLNKYEPGGAIWQTAALSADARHFFTFGFTELETALHVGGSTSFVPGNLSVSGGSSPVVSSGHVYAIEQLPPATAGRLFIGQRSTGSGPATIPPFAHNLTFPDYASARLALNAAETRLFVAAAPSIRVYDLVNGLPLFGDDITVGDDGIEMAPSFTGNALFYSARLAGVSFVGSLKVLGNGNLDLFGQSLQTSGSGKIFVDPMQSTVFVRSGPSILTRLAITDPTNLTFGPPTDMNLIDTGHAVLDLVDLAFAPLY